MTVSGISQKNDQTSPNTLCEFRAFNGSLQDLIKAWALASQLRSVFCVIGFLYRKKTQPDLSRPTALTFRAGIFFNLNLFSLFLFFILLSFSRFAFILFFFLFYLISFSLLSFFLFPSFICSSGIRRPRPSPEVLAFSAHPRSSHGFG